MKDEDIISTQLGGEDLYLWEQGLASAFGEPQPGATGSLLARLRSRPLALLDAVADTEPPSRSQPEVGDNEGHRYEVAGEIGCGGVGRVLRAHDRDLGREVAVKVLATRHRDPAVVARFLEEARLGGQLEHPGVVPVYDVGVNAAGTPYFAMKLVRGETLAALLRERQDGVDLLRVFQQICQVVAYAHARGVIHRDLKPSNVMVGELGEVHVLDWGFAKVLGSPDPAMQLSQASGGPVSPSSDSWSPPTSLRDESSAPWSFAGHAFGTPSYMAPEQAAGDVSRVDASTDVFCLGGILCEILTGAPTFVGGSARDRLRRSEQGDLADAVARLDKCSSDPELVELCRRCLQLDPADRPQSGRVVSDAVGDVLSRSTERAQQALIAAAAAESRVAAEQRSRRVVIALAVVVVVAVAVAALGLTHLTGIGAQAETLRRDEVDSLLRDAQEHARAGALAEAIRAAEQARRRAVAPGAGSLPELVIEADEALASLRGEHERLTRRAAVADVRNESALSLAASDRHYATAFATFGVDVEEQSAEQIAHLVRAVRDDRDDVETYEVLLTALDDWAARLEGPRVGKGRGRHGSGGHAGRRGGHPPPRNELSARDEWERPPARRREGRPSRQADRCDPDDGVGPTDPPQPSMPPPKSAPGERWRKLVRAAMLADNDPFRVVLRGAILADDVLALKDQVAFLDPATERSGSLVLLAMALDRLGEPELGTDVLLAGHRAYPADYWINFELGRAQRDDPVRTVQYARVAASLRPNSYSAWIALGVALLAPGPSSMPDDAMASFDRATHLCPDSQQPFQALAGQAAALASRGEFAAAIDLALRIEDRIGDLPFDLRRRMERLLDRR